jgi:hypothetical protein
MVRVWVPSGAQVVHPVSKKLIVHGIGSGVEIEASSEPPQAVSERMRTRLEIMDEVAFIDFSDCDALWY